MSNLYSSVPTILSLFFSNGNPHFIDRRFSNLFDNSTLLWNEFKRSIWRNLRTMIGEFCIIITNYINEADVTWNSVVYLLLVLVCKSTCGESGCLRGKLENIYCFFVYVKDKYPYTVPIGMRTGSWLIDLSSNISFVCGVTKTVLCV